MRKKTIKTLSYIILGLWIVAFVMILGVFFVARADAPERARTSIQNESTPVSAIEVLALATEVIAQSEAVTKINPLGIPFPEGSLEHAFFPLTGVHAVIECESCHADLVYAGTPTDCSSCHIEVIPEGHYAGDCVFCHNPAAWTDVIFDHTAVNAVNCQSCHTSPENHYAGQCANCHNTSDWRNVNFNHSGLNNCSSCHNNKAPANHYAGQCSSCHNTSNWSDATFDHSGQTNCSACHSPPSNHFAGECSSCHNTKNWGDATFDHAGQTNCSACHSPPNNHFAGECSSCHNTKNWGDATFDHSGQTNCLSCHKNDEPDEDDHPSGQQCSDCHNTNDWDEAEGDGANIDSVYLLSIFSSPHDQEPVSTSESLSLEQLAACSSCHNN